MPRAAPTKIYHDYLMFQSAERGDTNMKYSIVKDHMQQFLSSDDNQTGWMSSA